jgi:hypothetical protein
MLQFQLSSPRLSHGASSFDHANKQSFVLSTQSFKNADCCLRIATVTQRGHRSSSLSRFPFYFPPKTQELHCAILISCRCQISMEGENCPMGDVFDLS